MCRDFELPQQAVRLVGYLASMAMMQLAIRGRAVKVLFDDALPQGCCGASLQHVQPKGANSCSQDKAIAESTRATRKLSAQLGYGIF